MYYTREDIGEISLRHLRDDFKDLLAKDGTEEDIQQFLSEHPRILARGFIDMAGFIVPKFKFGAEYISDFLIADWRQTWCTALVELEPKEAKAFNKNGTPAKRLSQAMKQLAEWNQWIENHNQYFQERLEPHIEKLISHLKSAHSRYADFTGFLRQLRNRGSTANVVIIGRRGEDFPKEQERRGALSRFTGNNIEILSYDWLLDLLE
jgi:hypothetical protein